MPTCVIAEELNLNPKTVASVIKIFKETGRIKSNYSNCGRKAKGTVEMADYVKELIYMDVSTTLKTMQRKRFEICLAVSIIYEMIEKFNYTLKRVVLVPEARNTPENKLKRWNMHFNSYRYHRNAWYFLMNVE
jgi:hypothetical protein